MRVGLLLVVVGGGIGAGLHWNSSAPEAPFTKGRVQTVGPPPKAVPISKKEQGVVLGIASHFVNTAVLRQHVDESWPLTTRNMRGGLTRRQWATGDNTVVPYRAKDLESVRWRWDYSIKDHVGLQVSMLPKLHSHGQALVFYLDLAAFGTGKARRWLVDSWEPAGPGSTAPGSRGPSTIIQAKPGLSGFWLIVPIGGIIGLMLSVPLVLMIRGWRRSARAERLYRSSTTDAVS
jgi:hypothetical protein